MQAQRNEFSVRRLELKQIIRDNKNYLRTMYDTHELILYNNKIYVPQPLRKRMLNWYYHYLSHPGAIYLEKNGTKIMWLPELVADYV